MWTWIGDFRSAPARRSPVTGKTERFLHGSVTYGWSRLPSAIFVLPEHPLRTAGSWAFRSPGYGLYQPPEDPGVEGVQRVSVDQAGKAPGLERRRLHQLGRAAFFGPFYFELEPCAPGKLHLRPQADQAVGLKRFHPPEIHRVAHAKVIGMAPPLRRPAPPRSLSSIPRSLQDQSAKYHPRSAPMPVRTR